MSFVMLTLKTLHDIQCTEPVCPLNAVWVGSVSKSVVLPQLGHFFLVFPLDETRLFCGTQRLEPSQYLFITPKSITDVNRVMAFAERDVHVMVVMISPAFIEEMSSFLGIPAVFQDLLDTLPLLKGDVLSETLEQLAKSIDDVATREELFMDVIGSMLQILRLRHRAVAQLAGRKAQTIDDLLICMLRARQFLDARYLEDIKTQHVAAHVGLSEYHFARLFKTAFGITVHQYVIQLRLRAARNLLEASDKSITEIALTMSYQSLSAFINAFRRYVGVSPSVYRSKLSRLSK